MTNTIHDLPIQTGASRFQEFNHKAALFCTLTFAFFIPISTALMNIFLVFTLLFLLLSGNLKKNYLMVWKNPVAKAGILLFSLLAIGTTWSIADSATPYKILNKYNELWYIALLMPIFSSKKNKTIGINIFLVSMIVVLIATYGIYLELIPKISIPSSDHPNHHLSTSGGFKTNIITNIMMSYAVFIFGQRMLLKTDSKRWIYATVFMLSVYYSLFISDGTTGQILCILLIILLLIQHFKWKSLALIPIFVIAIIAHGNFITGSNINAAATKILGGVTHDGHSASQRREFFENSIYLFQKAPFIGTGTGSFAKAYTGLPPEHIRTGLSKNPHNEYSSFAVQLGMIGILGLLSLFATLVVNSFKIKDAEQRYLAQGISLLIIVSSLGNTMIMDSGEGHFWAYFTAILFAPIHKQYTELSNGHN